MKHWFYIFVLLCSVAFSCKKEDYYTQNNNTAKQELLADNTSTVSIRVRGTMFNKASTRAVATEVVEEIKDGSKACVVVLENKSNNQFIVKQIEDVIVENGILTFKYYNKANITVFIGVCVPKKETDKIQVSVNKGQTINSTDAIFNLQLANEFFCRIVHAQNSAWPVEVTLYRYADKVNFNVSTNTGLWSYAYYTATFATYTGNKLLANNTVKKGQIETSYEYISRVPYRFNVTEYRDNWLDFIKDFQGIYRTNKVDDFYLFRVPNSSNRVNFQMHAMYIGGQYQTGATNIRPFLSESGNDTFGFSMPNVDNNTYGLGVDYNFNLRRLTHFSPAYWCGWDGPFWPVATAVDRGYSSSFLGGNLIAGKGVKEYRNIKIGNNNDYQEYAIWANNTCKDCPTPQEFQLLIASEVYYDEQGPMFFTPFLHHSRRGFWIKILGDSELYNWDKFRGMRWKKVTESARNPDGTMKEYLKNNIHRFNFVPIAPVYEGEDSGKAYYWSNMGEYKRSQLEEDDKLLGISYPINNNNKDDYAVALELDWHNKTVMLRPVLKTAGAYYYIWRDTYRQ